jgi:hypothetical protein
MANMTNQLLGTKTVIDALVARIAVLESQVRALQGMAFEVDSDNNFIPPLVEIPDPEEENPGD